MENGHINQYQLSKRWNISARTLEHWRWEGIGPLYLKLGRRVLYRISDIEAYEAEQLKGKQPQPQIKRVQAGAA